MATLAECIELHETARRQEPAAGTVTAKGIAIVAVYQLKRALIDMEPADRDEIRGMLAELVTEQHEQAWADFGHALAVREG